MFSQMDTYQTTFWICAIAGTCLFMLKAIVSVFAGFEDGFTDVDSPHQVVHDGAESSDAAFKVFSITSLTGFFMMFGWSGLAAYEQADYSSSISLLVAFIVGSATMYITALIFKGAGKLAGGGAKFDISQTVGRTASVYQQIPATGKGRIQIAIADVTHEIDAISEDGSDIKSFTDVEIVRIAGSDTVSVRVSNSKG